MQLHDDEQFSGTTKLGSARQLQVQLLVTDALRAPSSDKEIDNVSIYIVSLRETKFNENLEFRNLLLTRASQLFAALRVGFMLEVK